ncbi:hypothetical protein G9464_01475 [Halostella sp. JP-L12]|nr:hypothetical protein [Halostella sp. JP-L12]
MVTAGVGTALATAGATPAAGEDPDPNALHQSVETDEIRILVSVDENGTARWEMQYWTRLDDDNSTQAFEDLQRDVEENPENYTSRFRERIERTAAAAENETGREMSVRDVSVRAETRSIPQEYGVVTYSFTWERFAAVDGSEIRIGDAIRGFFLSDETRMTVEWPAGYEASVVSPDADDSGDRSVTWRGSQTDFGTDDPRILLGPSNGGDGADGDSPDAWMLGALALVGAVGVAALAYWARHRDARGDETTGATGGGGDADAAGEGDGDATDDGPPPELLSNEERVLRLLDQQGGRMKQQEVVQALDWTEAKTSQVVSDLRDEGKVESFRLGRENVLSLPDEGEE